MAGGDAHFVHAHPACVAGVNAHLAFDRTSGQPFPAALQNEGGDAIRPLGRVGFGKDEETVSYIGEGDPHFFAADEVIIPIFAGVALHACHIRPCIGFGEAEAGDFFACGQRGQKFLFLLVGSPLEDG